MNKLEWEMKKQTLEYHKEICENTIRTHRNNLVSDSVIALICAMVAIWLIRVGTLCLINGSLFCAILDFVLAATDIAFSVCGMSRIKVIKRILVREKAELDYLNSEIQSLEVMVV